MPPPPANVIVAGAGPVGLTAALTLAMQGIPVTLLEKRPTLNTASRASTIHPPTLEILDRMDVLAQVQSEGERAETIQYRTPEGIFATFDLALLHADTKFPYRLHLEQARITPVMLARLKAYPHAEILFDAEAIAVTQTDHSVTLEIRRNGQPQTLETAYLIAAEGARSNIRDSLGIPFDGLVYPHKILRVMTHDDLDAILPGIAPVTYLHNAASSVSFLKMPDCWRIILRVPHDVPDAQAMDEAWILARFQDALPSATTLPGVVGKDIYSVSRRVAGRFREGRTYLAGDAAHVTNTRGGMNMNCGFHDGAALGQAIARAIRTNDQSLVDAASDERRRIATEHLIPRTDRNVTGGAAWMETLRQTAQDPGAARAYLRTSAMLDMLSREDAHV